jgi:hypothetical protein
MIEPVQLEITPHSTIDYYRIHEYFENYTEWVEKQMQWIVPYNQLVYMVMVNDISNNLDSNKIVTVSMEYNIIPFRIYQ